MNTYSVYNGEYPFDMYLGTVSAIDEEQALSLAIQQFGKEYPHPIIELQNSLSEIGLSNYLN